MRRLLTTAAVVAVLTGSALACPVCFDSSDGRVLRTYSISTMFLSGLPFAVMAVLAGVAVHLRRQADAAARDAAAITVR